jgi:hypothetical protein
VTIGAGARVVVAIAVAGMAVAAATAVLPFHDSGVACGVPLTSVAHGKVKVVAQLRPGGPLVVLTKQQQAQEQGLFGLSGIRLPPAVSFSSVVCRTSSRRRVAFAAITLGTSMIVLGVAWRTSHRRPRYHAAAIA